MTLLVVSRRLKTPAGAPGAGGETVIDAVVVTDNTTGSSLVQIFLPLPPGLVTDQMMTDRKVVLEVNGVEQAVFMKAARGRYPAGFLGASGGESLRCIQGHFTYNIPDTNAITAQFIVNRVRTPSDLSETTITDTHLTNRRACLPSSATYLCSTWFTFQPLLAAASENAQNDAYFNDLFDTQYETMKNLDITSQFGGGATYEHCVALWARWCQTADRKYFWNAWIRARALLPYNLPDNGSGHWTPEPNPQSIVTGNSANGLPSEAHSQRFRTYACAYLATGQIAYYNVVCINHCWGSWRNSTAALTDDLHDDAFISPDFSRRFNIRNKWGLLMGVLIDANVDFGGGAFNGRELDHPTELPWYLDALGVREFNLGDYRDGMTGYSDASTDNGGFTAGDSPHFQVALFNDWLLFYYLNVKADSRIPTWIKTNVDAVLGNILPVESGEPGFGQGAVYGYTYTMLATPLTTTDDPWTLPMHAPAVKFCEKFHGNNTVNGATYSTWYTRLIDPGQVSTAHLNWDAWKIFGECFANTMLAGYLDQNGIPTGLNSTIRTPTQY